MTQVKHRLSGSYQSPVLHIQHLYVCGGGNFEHSIWYHCVNYRGSLARLTPLRLQRYNIFATYARKIVRKKSKRRIESAGMDIHSAWTTPALSTSRAKPPMPEPE